ncbi:MAG: helix-turn-helix transcriptional regulator [Clostridiales bacterium]|nr:helix-turn-helix transcriptional regulator [Clostridiales bacterium]
MRLCTECHWEDWDRIVDIYPERCDTIPEHINDEDNYKIILLEKGSIEVASGKEKRVVKAPALIELSQSDKFECRIKSGIKAYALYFNPTVIREEFTYDKIDSGEFKSTWGTSIYQDYVLIERFSESSSYGETVIELTLNSFKRMKELFVSAEKELLGQRDGFWPCRSRSYLMELLYFIVYTLYRETPEEESTEQDEFSKITEFLNEHIEEQITLETITKKFAINRNKLNALFEKHSSMTCMNYLQKLRIDLAKILLSKTEIPISEVSARVGFSDPNYFAKLFKKTTGVTPSKYRYP